MYTGAALLVAYTGLAISLWPNIIPPAVSIWDAAAPMQSMGFTLVGALFIIPFIRVVLLRLPRQGESRRGLSLMKPSDPPCRLWQRHVGWFILLWTASVGVLAIVALVFRMLMNLAGMTV